MFLNGVVELEPRALQSRGFQSHDADGEGGARVRRRSVSVLTRSKQGGGPWSPAPALLPPSPGLCPGTEAGEAPFCLRAPGRTVR